MAAITYLGADKITQHPVTTSEPLPVIPQGLDNPNSDAGTVSSVASAALPVMLLPANPARKGVTIYNASTAILYVILSSQNASTTFYTFPMPTNSYYEIPFRYRGVIGGVWASSNGFALMTELR